MRRVHRPLTAVVTLLVSLTLGLSGLSPARADDTGAAAKPAPAFPADFHRGLLISDKNFYDSAALTEKQIASFIKSWGASCRPEGAGTNAKSCLKI